MKRQAIAGAPPVAERPFCHGCTKRMRPDYTSGWTRVDLPSGGWRTEVAARTFNGYQGYDGFHSLRCALRFARAAYAAGFRITKGRRA